MRKTCDIFIEIDLEKMLKEGIKVYKSQNDVILTDGINKVLSTKYFKNVLDRNKKSLIN